MTNFVCGCNKATNDYAWNTIKDNMKNAQPYLVIITSTLMNNKVRNNNSCVSCHTICKQRCMRCERCVLNTNYEMV